MCETASPRLTLEHMKKEARDLLNGLQRRDPDALKRYYAIDPFADTSNPALDDARFIIAHEQTCIWPGPPTFRAAPAGPFPQQGRSLVGGRQSGCPRDATDEEIVDPPPKGHASPTSPNSILDLENLDHPCFPVYLDRRALRRLAVHLVVLVPGGAQQFAETQMRRAATANIETLGRLRQLPCILPPDHTRQGAGGV